MSEDRFPICDSQIHAPDVPHAGKVGGFDYPRLMAELDTAGVDRCIIVPPAAPGPDPSLNNGAALEMASRQPNRLAVMGRFNLTDPSQASSLAGWRSKPGMLGIRVSFVLKANRDLFGHPDVEWFWKAASESNVPVMVLVTNDQVAALESVAARYEGLRLTINHFGLTPYVHYQDLMEPLQPVLRLAQLPNVSIKASALPDSVPDPYPFPTLHEPIRAVVDKFGPRRVFWGSDLTRLKCKYSECLELFSEELSFLSTEDREWILGRGVMEWLGWDHTARVAWSDD